MDPTSRPGNSNTYPQDHKTTKKAKAGDDMAAVEPSETSRYILVDELEFDADDQIPDGSLMWDLPEPVDGLSLADDYVHTTSEGDTWFTIAALFYDSLDRPSQFYWAICDYQSPPISDPLMPLGAGISIRVPSLRTLQEIILSEDRREISAVQLTTEFES